MPLESKGKCKWEKRNDSRKCAREKPTFAVAMTASEKEPSLPDIHLFHMTNEHLLC